MTTKKKKTKEPHFTGLPTYVDAVAASKAALDAFDLKTCPFEELECGYDGHELKVPGSPLFVPALFEGVNLASRWTDYEFMVRHACVGALQHFATDQLRYLMLQPDWLYFMSHPSGYVFQNFKNDGSENWSDEIEVKREKTIRGALDFLVPWLHVVNQAPASGRDTLYVEAEKFMGLFAVETAFDIFRSIKDPNGVPKDFGCSKDELAAQTTLAIILMCSGGSSLPKRGPLHDFYEETFLRGPKEKGKRQNGDGVSGGTLFVTHAHPVTNWFWEFTKLAKQRGWLHRSAEVRKRSSLAHAGRGAVSSFRLAMDDLQAGLSTHADVPALFDGALNFIYDNAGILAEHGIGIINEPDVALALRKVEECPEAYEGPVAQALCTAARALVRICPTGAVVPAGTLQHLEMERMTKKGYPHLCSTPRSDIGRICIRELFGKITVSDLPTVKKSSIEIDPAVICDAKGSLLPYEDALKALKEKYNDFTEGPLELNEAGPKIAEVNPDAALSFYAVIQQVFGEAGTTSFNELRQLDKENSSYTQIDKKGNEVGTLPMTVEFDIGSKHYVAVFLGSYASKEIAEASAEPILKGAAAWAIYNSYSDCGKSCWLRYRGLLGDKDELHVKEYDPKKDLKPGMYQDFVDFCWEAVEVDKWTHELCRYDGVGQIEYVDLQSNGDEAPPTHAWGIWRE